MDKKTVLLTGGSGFWGKYLWYKLTERGYDVIAPTRKQMPLDSISIRSYINRNPDYIIHAAAHCGGLPYNKANPYELFYDNLNMGSHLLDTILTYYRMNGKDSNLKKFVHFSTICAYPKNPRNIPFREDDLYYGYPEETNAPYAMAKRAIMEMGNAARAQYGLPFVTVMPTNTYGPGDCTDLERSHIIGAALNKIDAAMKDIEYQPPTFFGDGKATRDFLYVEDGAEVVIDVMERYDDPVPLNIGSGRETSIREIVELVAQTMGYKGVIKWTGEASLNGQPRRVLDTERIFEHLGFIPRTTLEEGIRKTVAWYNATQGNKTG